MDSSNKFSFANPVYELSIEADRAARGTEATVRTTDQLNKTQAEIQNDFVKNLEEKLPNSLITLFAAASFLTGVGGLTVMFFLIGLFGFDSPLRFSILAVISAAFVVPIVTSAFLFLFSKLIDYKKTNSIQI
jgi:hypothetical protein